jgi:hypothetical protein
LLWKALWIWNSRKTGNGITMVFVIMSDMEINMKDFIHDKYSDAGFTVTSMTESNATFLKRI